MLERHFLSYFRLSFWKKKRFLRIVCCLLSFCSVWTWYEVTQSPDLILSSRWPNFTLILPEVEPAISSQEDRTFYLVVVVNSAATGDKHRHLRNTIRGTWGNSSSSKDSSLLPPGNTPNTKWKLFFVLGKSENAEDRMLNLEEASQYKDVLIGDFIDQYENLITKTYMSHYWASTRVTCKYILKTDDDVYVRVPKLVKWLQEYGKTTFYGGKISRFHKVPRDPSSKWFITREQYSPNDWPPFCHGAFHVLSSNIVPKILHYTTLQRPFHADDAYLSVASKHYNVSAVQIPGFQIEFEHPLRNRADCELIQAMAIGHKLKPSTMRKYYAFYEKAESLLIQCSPATTLYKTYNILLLAQVWIFIQSVS